MNVYLFPCTCGQVHRITTRQAGEQLQCSCGTTLELPTMREIVTLERATDLATRAPKGTWGRRQGIIFLGIVLMLGAGAIWGYFRFAMLPRTDNFRMSDEEFEAISPTAAWEYWTILRNGMPNQISPQMVEIVNRTQKARRGMNLSLLAAAVGLALAVGGVLIPKSKPVK
jgi:hypothetical protein